MAQAAAVVILGVTCLRANQLADAKLHLAVVQLSQPVAAKHLPVVHPLAVAKHLHLADVKQSLHVAAKHLHLADVKRSLHADAKHLHLADVKQSLHVAAKFHHATADVAQARAVADCCRNFSIAAKAATRVATADATATVDVHLHQLAVAK